MAATVKMMTAVFCGDGTVNTVDASVACELWNCQLLMDL